MAESRALWQLLKAEGSELCSLPACPYPSFPFPSSPHLSPQIFPALSPSLWGKPFCPQLPPPSFPHHVSSRKAFWLHLAFEYPLLSPTSAHRRVMNPSPPFQVAQHLRGRSEPGNPSTASDVGRLEPGGSENPCQPWRSAGHLEKEVTGCCWVQREHPSSLTKSTKSKGQDAWGLHI